MARCDTSASPPVTAAVGARGVVGQLLELGLLLAMLPILRRVVGIAIAALGAAACCAGPPVETPSNAEAGPVQHVRNATVMLLENIDGIGEIGQCAAVFIGAHEILTARHCVCEADVKGNCAAAVDTHKRISYITYAEWQRTNRPRSFVARVAKVGSADLALLVSDDAAPEVASVTVALPEAGERVFAVGHPRSDFFAVMQGRALSLLVDPEEPAPSIAVQMPLWGGASGGPLCLADGRVIGIASVKLTGDGAFGGYTPIAFMP